MMCCHHKRWVYRRWLGTVSPGICSAKLIFGQVVFSQYKRRTDKSIRDGRPARVMPVRPRTYRLRHNALSRSHPGRPAGSYVPVTGADRHHSIGGLDRDHRNISQLR